MLAESILAACLCASVEISNDSWPDHSQDDLDTFGLDVCVDRWGLSWHILTNYATRSRADEARLEFAPIAAHPWARLGVYASGNLGGEAVQVWWHDALSMNDRRGLTYDTLRASPELSVRQEWPALLISGHANAYNAGARAWLRIAAPCGWGRVGPYLQTWQEWGERSTAGRVHDQLAPAGVRWELIAGHFLVSIEGASEGTRGGLAWVW